MDGGWGDGLNDVLGCLGRPALRYFGKLSTPLRSGTWIITPATKYRFGANPLISRLGADSVEV